MVCGVWCTIFVLNIIAWCVCVSVSIDNIFYIYLFSYIIYMTYVATYIYDPSYYIYI